MVVVAADGRGVFWQQKFKRPVRVEGKINAAMYRDMFDQKPAPELSGPWSPESFIFKTGQRPKAVNITKECYEITL